MKVKTNKRAELTAGRHDETRPPVIYKKCTVIHEHLIDKVNKPTEESTKAALEVIHKYESKEKRAELTAGRLDETRPPVIYNTYTIINKHLIQEVN